MTAGHVSKISRWLLENVLPPLVFFAVVLAAWQGATVHEDASGADVCAAIEIDGGQSLVVAEFQNARRKFGCDEQRWLRVFPVGKQGLQLR